MSNLQEMLGLLEKHTQAKFGHVGAIIICGTPPMSDDVITERGDHGLTVECNDQCAAITAKWAEEKSPEQLQEILKVIRCLISISQSAAQLADRLHTYAEQTHGMRISMEMTTTSERNSSVTEKSKLN